MTDAPAFRLGVIGGLGPLATVDFYAKITRLTPAGRDREHLPIAILSAPHIPDRTAAILTGGPDPLPALVATARRLDDLGVEAIAVTCNTAHHWHDALAARCRARLLHIADGVERALGEALLPGGRVAVLATRGTMASGFYQRRLALAGYALAPAPEEAVQVEVDTVIAEVKAGRVPASAARFAAIMRRLEDLGFDAAVLACTELPVAHEAGDRLTSLVAVDSTLELARDALIRLGMLTMPHEAAVRRASAVG